MKLKYMKFQAMYTEVQHWLGRSELLCSGVGFTQGHLAHKACKARL